MPAGPVVSWLSSLKPETVGSAIGTAAFALWLAWAKFSALRNTKAFLAADKEQGPVAPMQPAALPQPASPLDVTDRLVQFEVKARMAEWTLDQARARCRELEATVRELGADGARTAQALSGERVTRERAELALRHATEERDAAEDRARTLAAELSELKRDLNAGHTLPREGLVTPLRPRRP